MKVDRNEIKYYKGFVNLTQKEGGELFFLFSSQVSPLLCPAHRRAFAILGGKGPFKSAAGRPWGLPQAAFEGI